MTQRTIALLILVSLCLGLVPASAAQPGPWATLAEPSTSARAVPAPRADLSASTIDAQASVRAGDVLTYTITLRSPSDTATIVDVVDPIPAHTTYVVASCSTGEIAYEEAARQVTWHGPVGASAPVTLTVSVRVDAGTRAGTDIANTATVTEAGGTPLALEAHTSVIAAANLTDSTLSVDREEAMPGDILTYSLDVVNSGNTSRLILVTNPVPAHTTYVEGSATNATYDREKGEVYWSGSLPATVSRHITFQVRVDGPLAAGTVITNTASINDFQQPVTRQAVTTIGAAPNLASAVKTANPACVASGDLLTYTIALTNTGSVETTACITDAVPTGTTIVGTPAASAGTATYDSASGEVRWCGPLLLGEAAWVRFTVEVTLPPTATGVITNTASIGSEPGAPLERSATAHVPLLWLDCPTPTLEQGDTADVNLKLSNVVGLQYVEARLEFPPGALELVEVVPGTWLSPTTWTEEYDSATGTLRLSAALESASAGLEGSGTLATVRLRTLAPGSAALALAGTHLSAALPPGDEPIAHNTAGCTLTARTAEVSGRVVLQGRTGDHAGAQVLARGEVVATTAKDGSYSFPSPGPGARITITMPGYLPAERLLDASGDVTLPPVTLLGGDVVGAGVLVSRGGACGGAGTETIPGPPDGIIDIRDLAFITGKFGMRAGDTGWGPDPCYTRYGAGDPRNYGLAYRADFNGDGRVNIVDVTAAAVNSYRAAPSPWP